MAKLHGIDLSTLATSPAEARERGDTYYIGKPCKKAGHDPCVRYAGSRDCAECKAAWKRERRADPEVREKDNARDRKRYADDEEFREKDNARSRQYQRDNLDKINARNARREARKRNAEQPRSQAERAEVEALYQFCNVMSITRGYQVDHKQSLTNGGSNRPQNLQVLEDKENSSKGNRDLDWLTAEPTPEDQALQDHPVNDLLAENHIPLWKDHALASLCSGEAPHDKAMQAFERVYERYKKAFGWLADS